MRVLADNKPARSGTTEYVAAIEVCRKRRAEGLLADLPGYSDFDCEAAFLNGATPQSVEVEFITRPKTGGGIRLEVVPDFETAVSLQMVADELAERGFDLPHSASALQVTRGERPGYARWSETIPMWVRRQLVAGTTVVVADVEDYFGSVPACRIESALRDARLDPQGIERILSTVRDINSRPESPWRGAYRSPCIARRPVLAHRGPGAETGRRTSLPRTGCHRAHQVD